ncbi:MAG: hypothetical protein FWC16_01600 [Defluviitaleaceae bacterium]|nr:hypothetical protein [Defluviitaleaceae bacterium]MCL2273596.1 hypothetical protein [Defluviitaleaceae bacterium]
MRRIIQAIAAVFATSTYALSGGGAINIAPATPLWTAYAETAAENAQPLAQEAKREAPPTPPPARLFVSAEGRYAIQQGWLAGADYQENKIATHGEAVAMIMQIASLYNEDITFFGEFDADTPLTREAFTHYLRLVFHNLPEEGVLDLDANGEFNPEKEVTWVEMARAAYRLRGLNPHYVGE